MNDAGRARELHQCGELATAAPHYLRAIASRPDDLQLRHDYAVLLMQSRREAEAVPVLDHVLERSPARADTATVLALCLRAAGDLGRAREAATRAIMLDHRNPLPLLIKGSIELAAGGATEAETALRRCLEIAPRLTEAWHYLGESLQAQRRWAEAIQAYRRILVEQPTEVMNIAICAELAGDLETARDGYRRMCALRPERSDCLARLAQVEAMMCEFEAEKATVARLESKLLHPDRLPSDDYVEGFPLSFLPLSDSAKRVALERYAGRVKARAGVLPPLPPPPLRNDDGRIRIGYLSADFGNHALGRLLCGLFKAHDRNRFTVNGYSLRTHADTTAERIRAEFDRFQDCESMPSDVLARLIREDDVDVLVDLGGYTQGARPEVLALRPVRVQLGWLGFIHGQEASWLDSIVLDWQAFPEGASWPYSDAVMRIPGLMLPAGSMPSGTADRVRFGLPQHVPLLASFNNSYKLDEALVLAWVRILQRAPRAHLLVYLPRYARAGFLRHWQGFGGDAARLHFAGRLPIAEQADRAASCDLFLDAFRYQAGATAIASAASGLPILCRAGTTPLARLSVSLNHFLGLEELICADTATYIERAARLANTPSDLHGLRERMLEAIPQSRLFDPRRTAAAIEDIILRQAAV